MSETTFTAPGATSSTTSDPFASDRDLADLEQVEHDTDLKAIEAELDDDAIVNETTIPIDNRPGWAVVCRLDFTGRDLDNLRKRAKDKRFVDNIDGIKFAALLLGLTCVDVIRNGKPLGEAIGVDGRVTFATREVQELAKTVGSVDATVRKVLGRESAVETVSRRLMTEAGWGDEAYANPTD